MNQKGEFEMTKSFFDDDKWLNSFIITGVSNCPLKFVCSAGQCSRPLRTALGSAVQCSAVIEQSNFRENLGSFGQFFYCFSTDFFLFFAAMEKFS